MKQHITPKQLNGLSEKGKERLREWWKPEAGDLATSFSYEPRTMTLLNDGDFVWEDESKVRHYEPEMFIEEDTLPLLSIGQMIEFLDEDMDVEIKTTEKQTNNGDEDMFLKIWIVNNKYESDELCDALFDAVKEVLEK